MAAIAYALSIHKFISSVGADAGFAAILGLAIMVLLFFAQARETAWLRRRADEAEEQLAALSAVIDRLSRQRAAAPTGAPVAPAPASARLGQRPAVAAGAPAASRSVAPVPAGAVALAPAAPAGVGAPALSSATRLIPLPEPDEISIRALHANGHAVAEPAEAEAEPVGVPDDAGEPDNRQGPPPSTAAGGANGHSRGPVPAPPRDAASSARPAAAPASAPRMPAPPVRPGASGRSLLDEGPRFSTRALLIGGAALAAVVIIVAVLLLAGSGSNTSSSSTSNAASSSQSSASAATRSRGRKGHRTPPRTTVVVPSNVTVDVLNGTSTNNLAHDITTKLSGLGYKTGTPATASDQTHTTTIVGYTQPAYRVDAEAVAKSLGLSLNSVAAVSQSDRTVACSGSTATCPDQVIVTVGSDLSSAG